MAKKNKKKISLNHFRKTFFKSRTFFVVLALIFLSILGFSAVSNLVFLGKQLTNSLNINVGANSTIKFDTGGFEKLKLVR